MTRSRSRNTPAAPAVTAADRPDLSFTAFHQMNRASYVRYAETYLRHRQDAEEAIDGTFEHLLRTWDQVLLTENPAAFAWTVMRNKVVDHARARTRRPPLIDEAAFDTVALCDAVDPIGQIAESLALFRALSQLTDRQQDVMVMIYLQGMNAPEAAAVLGMTSATVRSTVRHSLRRLREILGPDRTMEGRR
ncbi:sigma-70 family RNA polymerase sigma factor [Streptomyces sp. DSS69]|uniref:RNA polymerase sigma factor n=1 Tax=Streptomyces sp. DSS69 TaxID=3113369 RepID=UPI0031F8DD12